MEWDAIGAIGEIVGAGAVVLSLVYLGMQISGQNKEARIAAMHETVVAQRDTLRIFLEPQLSEDYLAVIKDFEQSNPSQRLRFTMALMIVLKTTQDAYLQFLENRLDGEFFHPFGIQLADLMTYESAKKVWELRKHQFDGRFRTYVDNLEPGRELYI